MFMLILIYATPTVVLGEFWTIGRWYQNTFRPNLMNCYWGRYLGVKYLIICALLSWMIWLSFSARIFGCDNASTKLETIFFEVCCEVAISVCCCCCCIMLLMNLVSFKVIVYFSLYAGNGALITFCSSENSKE